ncbi:7-cyano-7-deazaguanine synthase QueC [Leptospira mayottensis]|uniref:7-cyano-7-deazaguanine synthase n=2 Tax=Leptospira mayottensis TaxID=1137606 RepID=A0AA87MTI3_9LEPT|nr:7-cyano-7-deazaguanine synthase QueC [Leptospira mayottensis]AXR60275.1 7-cyano-7-deazaguanine synthase QueC [Leptospira mayottensis]AXR64061.1 7-cyano-7-deazaguanine synthase QueC [Leptospira mayottensis]AZQ03306.1 7-cyano-7-deazaguanine synthase QueC [Leptospira mayottensis 200901116]EKS01532.1 queuosine biosynthesis protein QueC [Leptospira mayottensis 200901122]TGN10850.1 7-cyano-7-deazaguanine synthase QueC [Leptospira mayottensis]
MNSRKNKNSSRKHSDPSSKSANDKAVVLLSGGLDSTTCLYQAIADGKKIQALSFDYGQRHKIELSYAKKITRQLGISHTIQKLKPELFLGSSLTQKSLKVPKNSLGKEKIPNTYVPGRNILFLSFAVCLAEGTGSSSIYIGVNAMDYSGYPDCRPEFIKMYEMAIQLGTKKGSQGSSIKIVTPLQNLSKKEIVLLGNRLQVPFHLTFSCYDPKNKKACGRCDACLLRKKGFQETGVSEK